MKNWSPLDWAKKWTQDSSIEIADREQIKQLIDRSTQDKEAAKEIEEAFYRDLNFGTGGLRAILGIGRNRMNKYAVRRATQAMSNVVNQTAAQNIKKAGVIGFDSRHFSLEFSMEVARVFAANGIKAYLYRELRPVCFVSFAIRHLNANCGVMVTASHNPPEYNGYKAYWDDGAQVTPPIDQAIIDAYNNINSFDQIKLADFESAVKSGMIEWMPISVEESYFSMLNQYVLRPELCHQRGHELKIAYTPIHGTGLWAVETILKQLGFTSFFVVEEQKKPDGKFPTVKSPNPENPEAMSMVVKLMHQKNCHVSFGTDPDTDRLGVVVNHREQNHYLNGNQIGALMFDYILKSKKPDPKSYFVTTFVTSKLLSAMAKKHGVTCELTLTGFKWICKRIKEIEEAEPERHFLFGTEESFGYMSHSNVRDKDGINSVALMAETSLYHLTNGKTLVEALDDIYNEYGYFKEDLLSIDYFGREGSDKISRIMIHFRNKVTSQFAGMKIMVIEDYLLKHTLNVTSGKKTMLSNEASDVLGLQFENGDYLYLRPSGTEPKIKFYIMVKKDTGSLEQKKQSATMSCEMMKTFIQDLCREL